ncbi:MAG: T9SS type A sorting domain-containing protein, partial [Bacteroidota bacterium]|nr:T9SS type A sorting domain-containing protein [Bacteroidota bacterium]
PWYTYLWNDGATIEDRTNLCAGNYSVFISDSQVGTAQAFTWTYNISASSHAIAVPFGTVLVNGAAPDVGDVIGVFYDDNGVLECGGYFACNGGTIIITAWAHDAFPGGSQNGFYTGDTFHWKLYRTADSIEVNMIATYSTAQTDQGIFQYNGLSAISSLTGSFNPQGIQQSQLLNFAVGQADSISINAVISNVDTVNTQPGSININPTGGTSPFSFLWSTGETIEDISMLDTGWYSVTLTDANLCGKEEDFYVDIAAIPPIVGVQNITNVSCNGACNGAIILYVSGGIPPYFYQWSNGETVEQINNLCPGFYYVTIFDTYDSLILDYEITEPTPLGITPTITDVDPFDPYSGAIDIIANGGIVPYITLWSNGDTWHEITGLAIGEYTVTIYDAYMCSMEEVYTLNYSYVPDSISINAIITNNSCNGICDGNIDVSISGGILPYNYLWASGDTIEDLNNLCSGNYELSITDALNGYQLMPWGFTNTGITMDIHGYAQINNVWCISGEFLGLFFQDNSNLKCGGYCMLNSNGGFIVHAFGDNPATPDKDGFAQGDSIYYKMWIVSDGNIVDLDISTYDTATFQLNFVSGVYSYDAVLSGNYTTTPTYTTASFTILEPDPISVSGIMSDYGGYGVSFYGASDGFVDVSVLGGTSPYNYLWTGGITSEDLQNIAAGQYELLVTDANLCDTVEVFGLSSPPPDPIVVTGVVENANCWAICDGIIEVTATGGILPLIFNWSNGETGQVVDNLCAGVYSLTINDIDSSLTVSFEIVQPDSISVDFVVSQVDPVSGTGGAIDATVSGGTIPYTFEWSNGPTNEDLLIADYGSYQLTVTDANLCQNSDGVFVEFMFTPDWQVSATQNQHIIEIPANANLLLNGISLSTNDFIGVFYDSSGTMRCGGYAVWQNQTTSLIAYGDETTTPNQEGFLAGNEFAWKFWDASENLVCDAVAVYLAGYSNQQYFALSGNSGIDSVYTNSISGTVSTTTKSNLDLGMVVLYEQTAQGYYAIKKGLVVNGNYKIDGLKTGNYICYAIPQPGNDWGIPGYYTTRDNWQGASWIHVQANTTGINIVLDPVFAYATGTANISGNIMVGDDASYNPAIFDNEWFPPSTKVGNVPARNIPILLYDSLQNAIDFRLTNEQGLFAYDNLEYGTYFVKVEKAGLQAAHIEVVLDGNNPTGNLNFQLNQGQVIGIYQPVAENKILLYPNPAYDKLNVVLPSDFGQIKSLDIFSQLGTKQNSPYSSAKEKQNILQIDLAGYATGIYLLKLCSDKNVVVVKFIKQ